MWKLNYINDFNVGIRGSLIWKLLPTAGILEFKLKDRR